jgi:hypothetical protein
MIALATAATANGTLMIQIQKDATEKIPHNSAKAAIPLLDRLGPSGAD